MGGLILLVILLVLAKGKSGGFWGGYQEVAPDPPPDRPVTEDEWGTAVPNWRGGRIVSLPTSGTTTVTEEMEGAIRQSLSTKGGNE